MVIFQLDHTLDKNHLTLLKSSDISVKKDNFRLVGKESNKITQNIQLLNLNYVKFSIVTRYLQQVSVMLKNIC